MWTWLGEYLQSTMEDNPGALTAAATAFGAALMRGAEWVWARWREYRLSDEQRRGEALVEIQRLLQRVPDETAVFAAFLLRLRVEGDGTLRDPNADIRITIHSEAKAPGVEAIRELWQDRPADDTFRSLILAPLLAGQKAVYIDQDQATQGPIRDQWLVADVQSVSVVILKLDPEGKHMWYFGAHHAVPVAALQADDNSGAGQENTIRSRVVIADVCSRLAMLVQEV